MDNHFLAAIIDIFEDFLDEKKVTIPSKERDEDPDAQGTNVYGSDYDFLMNEIRDVCNHYGIEVKDTWEK